MGSYHGKAVWKRCVSSSALKDEEDDERWTFSGSEFQATGAWSWKEHAPALFGLTRGTVRSLWEEEQRELEGEYKDRQQER